MAVSAASSWYGFGSALESFLGGNAKKRKEHLALLQKMHKQWLFFRTLVSTLDRVLAKNDLGIAARYVELVADERLGEQTVGLIQSE